MNRFKGACPICGNTNIEQHSKSVWCLNCGWAVNK